MADKQWIKVHTGLTNDPTHRDRIGNRVWYFMWLIGQVNWENGIVENYTDKWAAEEMSDENVSLSARTVERWRQELAEMGYITCHRGDQCQHVRIMKWRNPRLVDAPMINIPGNESTWYAVSRTPSRSNLRTPSIEDHNGSYAEPVSTLTETAQKARQILVHHTALSYGVIDCEQYGLMIEEYGADAFEVIITRIVERGDIKKIRPPYVRACLQGEQPAHVQTFAEKRALGILQD